jgi:hypothetical protein
MRMFLEETAIIISGLSRNPPSPMWVSTIQSIEGPVRTKTYTKRIFASFLEPDNHLEHQNKFLDLWIPGLAPAAPNFSGLRPQTESYSSPDFLAFRLRVNYAMGSLVLQLADS